MTDLQIAALASAASFAVLGARHRWALIPAVLTVVVVRCRVRMLLLCMLVVFCGHGLSIRSWSAFTPIEAHSVAAVGTFKSDPDRVGRGVRTVIELGGKRYDVFAYGRIGRRLERFEAGDRAMMSGELGPLPPTRLARAAPRHVVGEFTPSFVGDAFASSPAARAANRVRGLLAAGADRALPEPDRALFMGLVIGDDRDEPDDLIADFRSSGLSHLTAVSGQNVAFVLIAASPILRRLRPRGRWLATLGLIGWFAVLTRLEPSVLRASGMAALVATSFWRGWSMSTVRILALTVTTFVLIDPLLVWSVGWWLSVGATAGIAVLAGPLSRRLPGPSWVTLPLAASVAAQVGTLPVAVAVFGRAPLVGLPANALAGPVAGLVMVWGIPAGIVAGALPWLADIVHLPSRLGTRWVLIIGRLGARIEPDSLGRWGALLHIAIVVGLLLRPDRVAANGRVPPDG